MSAQFKFILLPPTEQQQEADLDWKAPLCFPGVSLVLPAQCYEFFIKPTASHVYSTQSGKMSMRVARAMHFLQPGTHTAQGAFLTQRGL